MTDADAAYSDAFDDEPRRRAHRVLLLLVAEDPERLDELLRYMLPREWLAHMSDRQCEVVSGQLVSEYDLRLPRVDLLVRFFTHDGATFYVSMAHRYRPDEEVTERQIGHAVLIHKRYEAEAGAQVLLPFTTSLVLYHGDQEWLPQYATRTDDPQLEQLRKAACDFGAFFTLLFDLRRLQHTFQSPPLRMWAAAYAMPEQAAREDLAGFVRRIVPGDKWTTAAVLHTLDNPSVEPKLFDELLAEHWPDQQEEIMGDVCEARLIRLPDDSARVH